MKMIQVSLLFLKSLSFFLMGLVSGALAAIGIQTWLMRDTISTKFDVRSLRLEQGGLAKAEIFNEVITEVRHDKQYSKKY
jgi:hypothetical protein